MAAPWTRNRPNRGPQVSDLLTISETAEMLRVSKTTVQRLIAGEVPNGRRLPCVRLGRRCLIRKETLARWQSGEPFEKVAPDYSIEINREVLMKAHAALILNREPKETNVYFIECPGGFVKIGSAVFVQRRFFEIQTASPQDLKLLGSVEGSLRLEHELHRALGPFNQRGEWFHLNPTLQRFIQESLR